MKAKIILTEGMIIFHILIQFGCAEIPTRLNHLDKLIQRKSFLWRVTTFFQPLTLLLRVVEVIIPGEKFLVKREAMGQTGISLSFQPEPSPYVRKNHFGVPRRADLFS